jgi:putative DNA primase/helicase
MAEKFFAEQLFEAGFKDLISVIPPGAQLTPSSKIPASSIGKAPGLKSRSGLWFGFDWRRHVTTLEDVKAWALSGANIGLRADRFPGVDIDTMDESLARIIEDVALAKLGPAPVRFGKAPKRLLLYRTAEPFTRMRLWIQRNGESHLVEILGQGQQYLVYGTHPSTLKPYTWTSDLALADITEITREQADAFLDELKSTLEAMGFPTTREGNGRPLTRVAQADQLGLLAPNIELLAQAVSMIPNTNDQFPDRTSYLRMGYAIRASAGEANEQDGFDIFSEWASRWEGNDRFASNDPDVVREDWRRMRGPYTVGWSWVSEQARAFGFDTATLDFDALDAEPERNDFLEAPEYSEQWLSDRVVAARAGELRYSPQQAMWYVWSEGMWQPDAALLAESVIAQELRKIAVEILSHGVTDKEKKENTTLAQIICSASKASNVRTFMQSDRRIAVSIESLDYDPWVLNTPNGVIDLKTGKLNPPNPDLLCTRSTSVSADFTGTHPEWDRFLEEATNGDSELQRYLQRLSGYVLTGSTREQQLTFIWGPGGNGKGVFTNVLLGIVADYAKPASMETFTSSSSDRHSTDIAMLAGARLVTASETQSGKRWDEAKVKGLTGGDPITARFMRQDNFTYVPQFKLVFMGNHKPEIRDVDAAMRRRIQLVPFTVTPATVDKELGTKLRGEWPAILAWMVQGCLLWQKEGLNPPAVVTEASREYFESEDAVGRWAKERLEEKPGALVEMQKLFNDWREWANRNGEYVGSLKRLSASLESKGWEKIKDSKTRRVSYIGYTITDRTGEEFV